MCELCAKHPGLGHDDIERTLAALSTCLGRLKAAKFAASDDLVPLARSIHSAATKLEELHHAAMGETYRRAGFEADYADLELIWQAEELEDAANTLVAQLREFSHQYYPRLGFESFTTESAMFFTARTQELSSRLLVIAAELRELLARQNQNEENKGQP